MADVPNKTTVTDGDVGAFVRAIADEQRQGDAHLLVDLTGGMELYEDLLAQLGQHTTGKGCLYLKRVNQADPQTLRDIIDRSYRTATQT
jgi:hypothetical protein